MIYVSKYYYLRTCTLVAIQSYGWMMMGENRQTESMWGVCGVLEVCVRTNALLVQVE
jgi:hypothetical protein